MTTNPRVLLITGATGKQGGAVINALISQRPNTTSSAPFTILALTRDPASAAARKLAAKSPLIKLLKGDLSNCAAIFAAARASTNTPINAVFSVQALGNVEIEEAHGKALIDESLKQSVKHFVYTSVDRGGDEKSWSTPTNVPHFRSKHNIELYLRERSKTGHTNEMTWTILRPVAFMDNFAPDFGNRVFFAALRSYLQGKKLQLVACKDIGRFGAASLLKSDDPAYRCRAIGLAGDELTLEGLVDVMSANTTNPVTPTFGILGKAFVAAVNDLGSMVKWFGTDGYGVDVAACRAAQPGMLNMETYLRTESAFNAKK